MVSPIGNLVTTPKTTRMRAHARHKAHWKKKKHLPGNQNEIHVFFVADELKTITPIHETHEMF